MNGYWMLFGRCISVNEALYLGTFSRVRRTAARRGVRDGVAADGADARPGARQGSPARPAGRASASPRSGLLMWNLTLSGDGHSTGIRFDPWLFRGGFFLTGLATLMVIAAVTHQRAIDGQAARQPGVQLGRHAQLRPVPVPLADLPDHPRARRCAADRQAVAAWRWPSRCRSPRPAIATSRRRSGRAGSANGCAAIVAHEPPRPTNGVSGCRRRHRQCRTGWVRRRQHRHGEQPVRRPDRVRQPSRPWRSTRRPSPRLTDVGRRCRHHDRQSQPRPVGRARPDRDRPHGPAVDRTADDRAAGHAVLRCRRIGDARRQAGARRPRHHDRCRGVEGAGLGVAAAATGEDEVPTSPTASSSSSAPTARSPATSTKRCSTEVSDVPRVVMMTVKAPKPWIEGNNEIIRSLPARIPTSSSSTGRRARRRSPAICRTRRRRRPSQRRHGQAVLPRHHPRGAWACRPDAAFAGCASSDLRSLA